MTIAPYSRETQDKLTRNQNDWRLFLKLEPYARKNRVILLISLLFLIPLAISAAIQPLIIKQAISLLSKTGYLMAKSTILTGTGPKHRQ